MPWCRPRNSRRLRHSSSTPALRTPVCCVCSCVGERERRREGARECVCAGARAWLCAGEGMRVCELGACLRIGRAAARRNASKLPRTHSSRSKLSWMGLWGIIFFDPSDTENYLSYTKFLGKNIPPDTMCYVPYVRGIFCEITCVGGIGIFWCEGHRDFGCPRDRHFERLKDRHFLCHVK